MVRPSLAKSCSLLNAVRDRDGRGAKGFSHARDRPESDRRGDRSDRTFAPGQAHESRTAAAAVDRIPAVGVALRPRHPPRSPISARAPMRTRRRRAARRPGHRSRRAKSSRTSSSPDWTRTSSFSRSRLREDELGARSRRDSARASALLLAIACGRCRSSSFAFLPRRRLPEAKDATKAKISFPPEGEAKFAEFVKKVAEAKRNLWDLRMKKEIAAVAKVTGLDADGMKALEAPAQQAAELCIDGWSAKFDEYFRKAFSRQPEQIVEMLEQTMPHAENYANANYNLGEHPQPTEHAAWTEGAAAHAHRGPGRQVDGGSGGTRTGVAQRDRRILKAEHCANSRAAQSNASK